MVDKRTLFLAEDRARAAAAAMPGELPHANVQITVGSTVYPRGAALPWPECTSWRNYYSMKASGQIVLRVPSGSGPKPRVLPDQPSQKPWGKPKVEIVPHSDVVQSAKLTLDKIAEQMEGDRKRAEDVMIGDREGGDLYRRAIGEHADRAAHGRTLGRIPPRSL
jgi:hypothetical protein